jgi:serine/threonine protein phosphatase PrpC
VSIPSFGCVSLANEPVFGRGGLCTCSSLHLAGFPDDLNYEAIAALRLGGSGPKKRQTASVHRVFEELPYVNRPEDVLFPVDAVPIAQLTALLRNPKLGLYCGFAMEQGKRSYMEDRLRCVPDVPAEVPGLPGFMTPSCFFGVFDGHGGQGGRVGDEVAEYLMKHLVHRLYAELTKHVDRYLRIQAGDVEALDGQSSPPGDVVAPSLAPTVPAGLSALALQVRKLSMANLVQPDFHNIATSVFRNIDAEVLSQGFLETAGSTCTVATLFGDALIVINTGDSDAVLCRNGEPKKLTVAHKAADPSEAQRIANAGGFVANVNGVWRVAGMLEVCVMWSPHRCRVCLLSFTLCFRTGIP